MNALLQLVVLQEEAIGLGGDDEAGGYRQLQVLNDYRQVIGFAAGEFRAVQGSLSQGDDERHLAGQAEPPPKLRLQGNENAVQSGVELEIAAGGNEIQSLHHMQQQGVHLFDGIRQVLAVENIFAAGFLSQIGNEFHNPLMILQQFLETLKDLRKGHQAWLGPLYPLPEVMEILEHLIFQFSVFGFRLRQNSLFAFAFPFSPAYLMSASPFEEVAHGKPGDNGNDYRQNTISGAVFISQRCQHGRKPHHDHLQVAAMLGDYLASLNHREANLVSAGFNVGRQGKSPRHRLGIA